MNLDTRMRGYAVWGVWDKVVGETVAQQAQPAFVRRGILFVKCSSSAWMQELHFMKGTIREELNRLLGKEVIKEIRFQMGEVSVKKEGKDDFQNSEGVSLNKVEREKIEEILSPLQDLETKEVIRRVMVKGASVKRRV